MSTAKDQISEIVKRQPDDSSYDEIVSASLLLT
jgi:hypothetical protein